MQANVDPALPYEQWPLDSLAAKVGQYCFILQNLTADNLREACSGDYEVLRTFLHTQGRLAYEEKVLAPPLIILYSSRGVPKLHGFSLTQHPYTVQFVGKIHASLVCLCQNIIQVEVSFNL